MIKPPAPRRCTITSAVSLSSEQTQSLERLLHARFAGAVHYQYVIDPHCLGGLRIQTHDWFFDTTLEGRLTRALELFLSRYANTEAPTPS